jgi:hypothetical protein
MLHVHAGSPGIFDCLPYQLIERSCTYSNAEVQLITKAEYSTEIEPFVLTRSTDAAFVESLRERAGAFLHRLSPASDFFLSCPKVLGRHHDALTRGRVFPLFDARVRRLSGLLTEHQLVIHLLITNQVDYLMSASPVPHELRIDALQWTTLSWANISWRILRSSPTAYLMIWNCENALLSLSNLFEAISGFDSTAFQEDISEAVGLDPANSVKDFLLPHQVALGERLDEQFEIDLKKLRGMTRVKLFSD